MALNKEIIYVTGLPRSGSTLLCQLLSMHESIYSIVHTSPLVSTIEGIRYNLSDSPFLLGQLDVDFDLTYSRLINAYRGFINGWFEEASEPFVVDKNRAWLAMLQTIHTLDSRYKMLVCLRDPVQVFGSIEDQHKKTILLDFTDHMNANSSWHRGDLLFSPTGVIGGPLKCIENMQDIGEEYNVRSNVKFVVYEKLLANPLLELNEIFNWLGLSGLEDLSTLPTKPHETDSYYRFKYSHKTFSEIIKPKVHVVSARLQREIQNKYTWLYKSFYPHLFEKFNLSKPTVSTFGNARPMPENRI